MWLWIYYSKIPIYPIFSLLKGTLDGKENPKSLTATVMGFIRLVVTLAGTQGGPGKENGSYYIGPYRV